MVYNYLPHLNFQYFPRKRICITYEILRVIPQSNYFVI